MSESASAKTTKRTKGGGPKTKAGKSTSALNSVRHSIQAKSVLPAELDAYRLHNAAVLASLEPEFRRAFLLVLALDAFTQLQGLSKLERSLGVTALT